VSRPAQDRGGLGSGVSGLTRITTVGQVYTVAEVAAPWLAGYADSARMALAMMLIYV
jgi:hypothetical protein